MDLFLLKLFISFVSGGLWVLFTTILADKFGTKIGGLVNGMPSTLLFGLLFIAWTQSPQTSVNATTIVPAIGGINMLFMASYIYFVRINFSLSLMFSVFLWMIFSFLFLLIHLNNFIVSILIYVILLLLSYLLVEHILKTKSIEGKKIKYSFNLLLSRGILSGFIIAFAVLVAKIGGPIMGGIFSMFPAATVSTILITHRAHGSEFSSGVVKSILLGSVGAIMYGLLVRYTYLSIGVFLGTLVSMLGAYLSGYLVYYLVIKKIR
ncbi:MAG: DUF3147 family protein [Candidatus Levyibacteriota bacterium]